MRVIDANAMALGVTSLQLMEAAGVSLASRVRIRNPDRVVILAGKGNNGGDGLVAARHLQHDGDCSVWYYNHPSLSMECRHNLDAISGSAVTIHPFISVSDLLPLKEEIMRADCIIDALIGTGSSGEIREPIRTCVEYANSSPCFIVSADIPTPGMRTDLVLSFHRPKVTGAEVAPIGIPIEAECFTGPGELTLIPTVNNLAHKGAGGKVLVIGGGPYQGAPWLTGLAAMRAGADLVTVASPSLPPSPDLIHVPLPGMHITKEHTDILIPLCREADVVICGNGLGTRSHEVISVIAPYCKKAVFDADALRRPVPVASEMTLYTPHAGEFLRAFASPDLLVISDDPIQRAHEVKTAVSRFSHEEDAILLKGPIDLIASKEQVRWNRTGTPAMTTGGTGDILAGVCGALLCHCSPFEAACIGSYATGIAGEISAERYGQGLIASDLLKPIAEVLYKRRQR